MEQTKAPRGFAAMSPERLAEIASSGGRAAHASGKGHKWTREEAITAGKLGGTLVSQRPGHMARIGTAGGRALAAKRAASKTPGGVQ